MDTRSWSKLYVSFFLAIQVVAVFFGLFYQEKHFNWVPYDTLTPYEISVSVRGEQLLPDAVFQRYHRPAIHRENRSIYNLIALVRQYEQTYGMEDKASVHLYFNINGKQPQYWTWPENYIREENTAASKH